MCMVHVHTCIMKHACIYTHVHAHAQTNTESLQ